MTVPIEGERAMFSILATHMDLDMCTQWDKSWDEYVRGNVVSECAAKLIRSLMLKTSAATGMPQDDSSTNDEGFNADDADIPTLTLNAAGLARILDPYTEVANGEDDGSSASEKHKTAERFNK